MQDVDSVWETGFDREKEWRFCLERLKKSLKLISNTGFWY